MHWHTLSSESIENSASGGAEWVIKDVTKGRKLREKTEVEIEPKLAGILTELQIQHAELALQQRISGDTELLLPATDEIRERKEHFRTLEADMQELISKQQLQIKSIEKQKQKKQLTVLKVEKQETEDQIKALQLEKSNQEEELAKEALGYEVEALREDVVDKVEEIHHLRTQQVEFYDTSTEDVDVYKPGNSLTGKKNTTQKNTTLLTSLHHCMEYVFPYM